MAANEEATGEARQPHWPTPDDPEWADASEHQRGWLEATQPEALAQTMTGVVKDVFRSLSRFAMFHASYPQEAFDNAMAQLSPERAELLREQLELSRTYAQERHEARDVEVRLEDNVFDLTMKAAALSHSTEQPVHPPSLHV